MSFLDKIPAEVQSVLIEGIQEIAGFFWHKITGDDDNTTAKDIAKKSAADLAASLLQEAENKIGAIKLEEALKELGRNTEKMRPWAEGLMDRIKKINEDDRRIFSFPSSTAPTPTEFDQSDIPAKTTDDRPDTKSEEDEE